MITILGATGNVGRKIADTLMEKGEKVRLVARSRDQLRTMVNKQAEAFAGDILETAFLVKAFSGADAVFTLIPPNLKADNFMVYANKAGESIARALEVAQTKYVVNLSSIGADLDQGTGPIVGLHNQEKRLNRIKGLNVLHIRAAYFMENLLVNIDLIKSRGIAGGAVRGDVSMPMVATKDIAALAGERLSKRDFHGSTVQELFGARDLSMIEAASIIGRKIGKPDLRYVMLSYEEAEKNLVSAGLSSDMSRLYVEMIRAFNEDRIPGSMKRPPSGVTHTTFEQFCDEVFVPRFMQKKAA
jgi:uncharacterized protein YbjT (DUF2867 family)